MAKKFKFPDPKSCKRNQRAVLCTGERVIAIYNQDSGKAAKRITKKVKVWFAKEAIAKGWIGVHFIVEIQTSHGAGCVLWLPQVGGGNVNVTMNMLVLVHEGSDVDKKVD